jgi:hypothetical protein
MLLNEFLKEHRKVQGLESTVAKQEATMRSGRTKFKWSQPARKNKPC